jgi:hypothetical protein
MSDTGLLQSFNINELAGATGLILGGVSGLLVVIFKSRCYCKFRIGCNDQCSLCMCERKPPPDPNDTDDEDEKKGIGSDKKYKEKKLQDDYLKQKPKEEPEPERLIPKKSIEPEPELDKLV